MSRKTFICGNWKLNHLSGETERVLDQIVKAVGNIKGIEISIAPVAPLLGLAVQTTSGSNIGISAQNVFHEQKGAFTGEWSVKHLAELGCKYAIIGHSERRAMFGETSETVAQKTLSCLDGGLVPIACVGETLSQRESGFTQEVIKGQIQPILAALEAQSLANLVLAYEPVWAIGTGKTATTTQAEEVHNLIRALLTACFGAVEAEKTRILYGGSVKPQNIAELLAEPNVDGALVGGASLTAESFCQLVQNAQGLEL